MFRDSLTAAGIEGDGSVILMGYTEGIWSGDRAGSVADFAAVKLDAAGKQLWAWQVRCSVLFVECIISNLPLSFIRW